ncbi:MAG TPA: M23 family metallopeptidase [Flavisolibacter sp.]|nr:M23 family metallopeptidase [Flavisolibacter sp.]
MLILNNSFTISGFSFAKVGTLTMKNVATLLLFMAAMAISCSSPLKNIFGKKTPHEQYSDKLDAKDLDKTPEGRQWLAASQKAISAPLNVELPYSQQGYFHADKPRALGLAFTAHAGERISFNLSFKKDPTLVIYADLFKAGGPTEPLLSADSSNSQFSYDIEENGNYILRLQPELFRSGAYNLSISINPSLGFPVTGPSARVESIWGDRRDGGKRKHEGIDIFAKKGSPAIAAADGVVTGVKEGGLGGKVVWMKAKDKKFYLYYAHLDKQLVEQGQEVKKGDVLGLVGNTGNARHTPSHLHFGVYTSDGPINPFPFVNKENRSAPEPENRLLSGYLKTIKKQKKEDGSFISTNTLLIPLAFDSKGYYAELPDGQQVEVPLNAVQFIKGPVRTTPAMANSREESQRSSQKKS